MSMSRLIFKWIEEKQKDYSDRIIIEDGKSKRCMIYTKAFLLGMLEGFMEYFLIIGGVIFIMGTILGIRNKIKGIKED